MQQGNNNPTPWQGSGQLGNPTHRATVKSLSWDLFCLYCINSVLSYRFPVGCRPALTVCILRGAIIRENYPSFTQHPSIPPPILFSSPMCHWRDVCESMWTTKRWSRMQFVLQNKNTKPCYLIVCMMLWALLYETNKSGTWISKINNNFDQQTVILVLISAWWASKQSSCLIDFVLRRCLN